MGTQASADFLDTDVQADNANDSSVEQPDTASNQADDLDAGASAEDQPPDSDEGGEQLSPSALKALHKMRQKDREELNELKNYLKEKEARDQDLAARIIGDVMRNPSKLGSYLDEYGLSGKSEGQEEDKLEVPKFEDTEELSKWVLEKAEQIAEKKARAAARAESTLLHAQTTSEQRARDKWSDLFEKDADLKGSKSFQRAVASYANDLLKEKGKYTGNNEDAILEEAYKEVSSLRGKPAPKRQVPTDVTDAPTPSVSKTIPKRRANDYDDVMKRIERKLSAIDAKYKNQ